MIHKIIKFIGHQALSDPRTCARRKAGIYAIHINAEMHIADLSLTQLPLDVVRHKAYSLQMDRLHRIDTQELPLDQCLLALVQTTCTNQEDVLRIHLVAGRIDIDQLLAAHAHKRT